MSFLHDRPFGSEYPRDHVHTMEVLAAITPNDVVRYMNLKAFGMTEPTRDATWQWTRKQSHFSCRIAMYGA